MNFDERVARKYLALKASADSRGLDFNLTLTSVKNLLRARRCKYTGIILTFDSDAPNQLTVDRIDNSKGYIVGNVVACSKDINQRKGNLSIDELEEILKVCKIVDFSEGEPQ